MKNIISLGLSIVIFTSIMPNCASASEQEVLAQYSGSTTASYGYKPNCTFTVNKIVGDKFRGSFSATNLGKYNINQSVRKIVITSKASNKVIGYLFKIFDFANGRCSYTSAINIKTRCSSEHLVSLNLTIFDYKLFCFYAFNI